MAAGNPAIAQMMARQLISKIGGGVGVGGGLTSPFPLKALDAQDRKRVEWLRSFGPTPKGESIMKSKIAMMTRKVDRRVKGKRK